MASYVLEMTTNQGFAFAQQNVRDAVKLITIGTAQQMLIWYRKHYKKTVLEIIETGEGVDRNVGRYADYKSRRYGIDHGLGVLSSKLYFGVSMAQPQVKETRGKEVRFVVIYKDPYYLAYVVGGTSRHIGRNFILVARDIELKKLTKMIGRIFDGLNFALPQSQLLSTIMGPNDLPSLRGFG